METEIWKPVVGYEGLYEISTFGRVKSLRKNKILIRNNKLQYIQIELWDNWKYKRETVHRLVAQAFIENTESKPNVLVTVVIEKQKQLENINGNLIYFLKYNPMTYTPIQLEAIKIFGMKDLTEGCIIFQPEYDYTFKIPEDEWDLMVAIRNWFRWTTILEISESKVWFEILWHIPHLFPDVARELQKEWYVLELLKVDTIKSVLKISRFDIKKDIIISYKKLIPLLDQSEETLTQLISLFK